MLPTPSEGSWRSLVLGLALGGLGARQGAVAVKQSEVVGVQAWLAGVRRHHGTIFRTQVCGLH